MSRAAAVVMFVAVAVAGVAGPALAKGENQGFRASATISGPGLDRPITVSGTFHGFLFSEQWRPSRIGTLLERSGLAGFTEQGGGYYTISPETSSLGPRYEVSYTLQLPATSHPIVEDLYPYATGGPMLFAPSGQRIDRAKVPSAWYVAPRALLATLVGLGLRATAPVAPTPMPSVAPPSAVPSNAPDVQAPPREPVRAPSTSGWPWAIALAGLASVLVVGAIAGRGPVPMA